MIKLTIPDMTCGHCADSVTKAVKSVDEKATIDVDLSTKSVAIHSDAEATRISTALEQAGYPATTA